VDCVLSADRLRPRAQRPRYSNGATPVNDFPATFHDNTWRTTVQRAFDLRLRGNWPQQPDPVALARNKTGAQYSDIVEIAAAPRRRCE
jgi:hypothetical protein